MALHNSTSTNKAALRNRAKYIKRDGRAPSNGIYLSPRDVNFFPLPLPRRRLNLPPQPRPLVGVGARMGRGSARFGRACMGWVIALGRGLSRGVRWAVGSSGAADVDAASWTLRPPPLWSISSPLLGGESHKLSSPSWTFSSV